jgi:hypothetical protein
MHARKTSMPPAGFRDLDEAFSKAFWDGRQTQPLVQRVGVKSATAGRDESAGGNNSQTILERF